MLTGLIVKKMGMTQLFAADGTVTAVTVLRVGPCPVVQVKTVEKDGYEAAQVAFDEIYQDPQKKKRIRLPNPAKAKYAKVGVAPHRILREFAPVDRGQLPQVGTVVDVKLFDQVERVKVTGTTKGKGFQGVVRRHGFRGGSRTHGSDFHRAPGAVGCRTTPGEVHKGKRMGGHMGNQRMSVRNLMVAKVDADRNLLYVRGAVPGPINGYVTVSRA
ncbi:MAG: 50S ribosomal protein L3 [Candidatus Riflebacteria bacterium]|nr:50S ribosomal protein L3 [Candidatus Riflebacteria bacterium]